MTRDELLARLAGLRQARVGQVRVPHKPLLLLRLFGQFAATGSSAVSYEQAEEPVSQLINDFGPSVASASAARQRAAMPFVHLERELWDLRDATGREIGPDVPERRAWLLERGAVGRLRSPVEQLLAGMPLLTPRPLQSTLDIVYISWHHRQVFRGHPVHADATLYALDDDPNGA
jgi:putative restriction endonuclease